MTTNTLPATSTYTEWEISLPRLADSPSTYTAYLANAVLETGGCIAPSPNDFLAYRIRIPAGSTPDLWRKLESRGFLMSARRCIYAGGVARQIHVERRNRGLSQRQLAEVVGVPVPQVYQAEYGEWTPGLAAICSYLGIDDRDGPAPMLGRLTGGRSRGESVPEDY